MGFFRQLKSKVSNWDLKANIWLPGSVNGQVFPYRAGTDLLRAVSEGGKIYYVFKSSDKLLQLKDYKSEQIGGSIEEDAKGLHINIASHEIDLLRVSDTEYHVIHPIFDEKAKTIVLSAEDKSLMDEMHVAQTEANSLRYAKEQGFWDKAMFPIMLFVFAVGLAVVWFGFNEAIKSTMQGMTVAGQYCASMIQVCVSNASTFTPP